MQELCINCWLDIILGYKIKIILFSKIGQIMRICNNFCFLGFVIIFNIVWLLRIFRDRNIWYIYVVLRSIIKIYN